MSYVITAPELMSATAADLAHIGSNVDAAHLMASTPTTGLLPAAADEVSTAVAALFSQHAVDYQTAATKMSAATSGFVSNLTSSAAAYASAESIGTTLLQGIERAYLSLGNAVLYPLEVLIEGQGPLWQVALVAFLLLLIPYTFSAIVLQEIIQVLTGQPI